MYNFSQIFSTLFQLKISFFPIFIFRFSHVRIWHTTWWHTKEQIALAIFLLYGLSTANYFVECALAKSKRMAAKPASPLALQVPSYKSVGVNWKFPFVV